MKQALVIGNGVSRKHFDLNELSKVFVTYGCNALYRDFIPDYLISMDWYMVREILDAKAHYKTKLYTQHMNDWDNLASVGEPINFVKTYVATPDSGNAAIELASSHGYSVIYLLGFDYNNGSHNNVYAGTKNYHTAHYTTPIIQDDKWRSRLYNIVKQYPDINYYRITDEECKQTLPNYNHIAIENFEELPC
jgi:hypothetical protein